MMRFIEKIIRKRTRNMKFINYDIYNNSIKVVQLKIVHSIQYLDIN
jgi:hypothetical protein